MEYYCQKITVKPGGVSKDNFWYQPLLTQEGLNDVVSTSPSWI